MPEQFGAVETGRRPLTKHARAPPTLEGETALKDRQPPLVQAIQRIKLLLGERFGLRQIAHFQAA